MERYLNIAPGEVVNALPPLLVGGPRFADKDYYQESWRPYPDSWYEVSDHGRVRTTRSRGGGILPEPRLIALSQNRGGYHILKLKLGDRYRSRLVHRMVLEVFVGPCPSSGHQARHLNGIPYDNRLVNLTWGTRSENMTDVKRHAAQWGGSSC